MKSLFLTLLASLTKKIIRRHRPFVVGITGTVGKTTVTNFVYDFLSNIYGDKVYMSPYNYNGEFGLPLTILLSKSPYRNPFLWIAVLVKWVFLLFSSKYPRYLVLEYGIDHAGEMDYLLDIVKPDYAIVLNISKNHVVQFPDFSQYIAEKMKLAHAAGILITNADDAIIASELEKVHPSKEVITYGIKNADVDYTARSIHAGLESLDFELVSGGEAHAMSYPLIGEYQVYNILPVFALGQRLGIDSDRIREVLSNVHPQKGRGSILKGVKESIIIDGSYNGGFNSLSGGVKYMQNLEGEYNKILFLGDMRELGSESKMLHTELAEMIVASGVQSVVLVGEEMKNYIYPILLEAFGAERVFSCLNSRLAGRIVRDLALASEQKSVIFVKGSQNTIYLEEGIKEFLYDMRDTEKLCRQSDHWTEIKNHFFNTVIAEV